MARDALRNLDRPIAAAEVLVLGASYREDVGDTRYSGSELIVRKLTEMGAELRVHDPYVQHWWEFESQDTYPSAGYSWARFFRNQEKLKNLRITQDISVALKNVDAVILAVRHEQYLKLDPDDVVKKIGKPAAIIDCFAILDDAAIKRYFELGCEVKGLGRGHVNRIKKLVKGI
jgi:UDP-N-acetyl-D-mannosaminuronate dehydrogenase